MCLYFGSSKSILESYSHAYTTLDVDYRKSTSRFLFIFEREAISWQLHKYAPLFTTEAKYITITKASKEMLCLKRFPRDLGMKRDKYIIHCDSQCALNISKNATCHSRTKHIDI